MEAGKTAWISCALCPGAKELHRTGQDGQVHWGVPHSRRGETTLHACPRAGKGLFQEPTHLGHRGGSVGGDLQEVVSALAPSSGLRVQQPHFMRQCPLHSTSSPQRAPDFCTSTSLSPATCPQSSASLPRSAPTWQ